MAVYTEVAEAEMAAFVHRFALGAFEGMTPIPQGVENTNYRVEAGAQPWVVTLYERKGREEVAADLDLTVALADRGVPCPRPVRGPDGVVGTLAGRPASVAPFVKGTQRMAPGEAELEGVGRAVARFHIAGGDLPARGDGLHGRDRLVREARRLADLLVDDAPETATLLRDEADHQSTAPGPELPGGVIHGDLFLDNVLFAPETPTVSAFLDLHMAGRGPWLFDVAVVLLDAAWGGHSLDGDRARAFLRGYRRVRPMGAAEFAAIPALLRRAALRFWCLRLVLFRFGRAMMSEGKPKNPEEFQEKLIVLRGGWGEPLRLG